MNLTSPAAATQEKKLRLKRYLKFSALENVLSSGAMAMLSTNTETQTEEILKKEHAEAQADARGIFKSNIGM